MADLKISDFDTQEPTTGDYLVVARAGTNYKISVQGIFDLASIQGALGPQGAQGTQGTLGAQGAQGLEGAQGAIGPVAGSDGQVVYNNGGVAGGVSILTFDDTTNTINVTGNAIFTSNVIDIPVQLESGSVTVAENSAGKMIVVDTSGGDRTVTFAPATVSGFGIAVVRKGSGNLTIAVDGVTKYNSGAYTSSNIAAQNGSATVLYTATNEIFLIGDIEGSVSTVQGTIGAQGAQGTTGSISLSGSDGQIIYNDGGAAQGTTGVEYNDVTGTLNVTSNAIFTSNVIDIPILNITADINVSDNAAGKMIVADSSSNEINVTFDVTTIPGFAITVIRNGVNNVVIGNTASLERLNVATYTSTNVSNLAAATVLYSATNRIYLVGDLE